MIYPGNPVHFTARTQIRGLENGELTLQPKWDGRRAVWMPSSGLWYKSGKPCDAKPWKDHYIPQCPYPLDLELMRDRAIVLDIIVPKLTLKERLREAGRLGLEIMSFDVNTPDHVRIYFNKCRTSGICDGVVLKRLSSLYPINMKSQLDCSDWVKVKDESIRLV